MLSHPHEILPAKCQVHFLMGQITPENRKGASYSPHWRPELRVILGIDGEAKKYLRVIISPALPRSNRK